jgi:hypothetical protein
MRDGTTARVEDQAGLWKEGLEAAMREGGREVIEEILHEEVEEALGARRSQRVAGRCGYRHGKKVRGLALRSGAVKLRSPGRGWSTSTGTKARGGVSCCPAIEGVPRRWSKPFWAGIYPGATRDASGGR